MMSTDKKRVQFRAPNRLINRADALATVLGEDRTDILVTALREYLQDAAHNDALTQEIAAAYYDDEITYEQLKSLVGAEEAANLRVLKQQLDDDFVDDIAEV
jgi:metal-responsive CopG/Arc/MetJ family transcriptional regulator